MFSGLAVAGIAAGCFVAGLALGLVIGIFIPQRL